MVLTSQKKDKRNNAIILSIIAELDIPVRGVTTINEIVFLAINEEIPLDYDFEIYGDEVVYSHIPLF